MHVMLPDAIEKMIIRNLERIMTLF